MGPMCHQLIPLILCQYGYTLFYFSCLIAYIGVVIKLINVYLIVAVELSRRVIFVLQQCLYLNIIPILTVKCEDIRQLEFDSFYMLT